MAYSVLKADPVIIIINTIVLSRVLHEFARSQPRLPAAGNLPQPVNQDKPGD